MILSPSSKTMDAPESLHTELMNNLHKMATIGDTKMVLSVVDEGTEGLLDRGDSRNNTALHLAIWYGHKDTAKALVKRGASLTILNDEGKMPISYCSSDPEMLETLLLAATACESGLHWQATWKTDSLGRSILHYASLYLKEARSMSLIRKLMSMATSEQLLLRDEHGATFLEAAAKFGNSTVVEALKGSIIHAMDTQTQKALINGEVGMSALMHGHRDFFDQLLALSKASSAKVEITLEYLLAKLKQATDEKLKDDAKKEEVETLGVEKGLRTYLALYGKKYVVFEFLLDTGLLTVNQRDMEHKRTCLHWAVVHKRSDIVEKLVTSRNLRPSPGIEDAEGKTALQIAFEEKNQEAMELLRGRAPFREYEEKLFRDREVDVQALNAVLVGAALIGSVTFSGWLQLPSQDAFKSVEMKVFWMSNGVSFYSAVAAMCVAIAALLPTPTMYVVGIAKQLKQELLLAVLFLAVSLVGVVMAFAGAGFVATGAASSPDSDCADDSYGWRHTPPSRGAKECESLYRKLMSGSTIPGTFLVTCTLVRIMYRLIMVTMRLLFPADQTEDRSRDTNLTMDKKEDLVEKLGMQNSKDRHTETLLSQRSKELKDPCFRVNKTTSPPFYLFRPPFYRA